MEFYDHENDKINDSQEDENVNDAIKQFYSYIPYDWTKGLRTPAMIVILERTNGRKERLQNGNKTIYFESEKHH